MSRTPLRCRWCSALFVDRLQSHEAIHNDLDFLNGTRSTEDNDGPPSPKRSRYDDYFDDEFLDQLIGNGFQTGTGEPAAAAPGRAPDLANPDSPVAGPSNDAPDPPVPVRCELDYDFRQVGQRTFNNRVVDRHYRVNVTPNRDSQGQRLVDLHRELETMFDGVIDAAREGLEGSDLGRVIVHHHGLTNPIFVGLRPLQRLSGRTVMDQVEAVLNSHQDLPLDGSFGISVGTMELPKGGRGNGLPLNVLGGPDSSLNRKRSIVEVINDDLICMARAIALAYLSAVAVSTAEWQALCTDPDRPVEMRVLDMGKCPYWYFKDVKKKNKMHRQTAMTLEICRRAEVPTHRRLTFADLPAFERLLDVHVAVISSRAGNKFVRVPEETEEGNRHKLYLWVEENRKSHFHAIVNICGFFGESKFCSRCLKPYRNLHQCTSSCFACKRKEGCLMGDQMSCKSCHVTFRSWDCFASHREAKRGRQSICERWWKCCTCKKVLDTKKQDPAHHVCGEWYCQCCNDYVNECHLCYLRASKITENRSNFIFFDFECSQDDHVVHCKEGHRPIRKADCDACKDREQACQDCSLCTHCERSWCGNLRHVPNLLVARKVCSECVDVPFEPESKCSHCGTRCDVCNAYDKKEKCYEREPCTDTCGFREVVYKGDETATDFGRWLFHERHKTFTAVAHNLKGYDGYFLLEYLVDNSMKPDHVIYSGSKIMYFHVTRGLNIRAVDSLNFLPMSLASLPDAFQLQEAKKGYFPHFFNRKQNQSYVGPYPSPEYYGCDGMKERDRNAFLQWHQERVQDGEIFDFAKEILEYCRSDVDILARACLKFRHLLMYITGKEEVAMNDEAGALETVLRGGIDPFDSITIASVCMKVFKSKFLRENWLAKVKKNGSFRLVTGAQSRRRIDSLHRRIMVERT